MLFWIATIIGKVFKIDIIKAQVWALVLFVALALLLVAFLISGLKSCLVKPAKVDIETIQKINSADEKTRREGLKEAFKQIDGTREARDEEIWQLERDAASFKEFKQDVDAETLERLILESRK